MFLAELREKHLVDNAIGLTDGAPWLQVTCHRHSLRLQHLTHRIGMSSNEYLKNSNAELERSQNILDTLN
jgi:transposase-like protein